MCDDPCPSGAQLSVYRHSCHHLMSHIQLTRVITSIELDIFVTIKPDRILLGPYWSLVPDSSIGIIVRRPTKKTHLIIPPHPRPSHQLE